MTTITVLTPRAPEIEGALRPRLPGDVRLYAARQPEELTDEALAAEIAFGAPDQLAGVLPRLPQLRWAQSTWAGITPFLEQPRRDFLLTGAKGIFGAAMSEYVLGWILALERSVLRHATATHWNERRDRGTAGLRVGIAGVGSIGQEVARRSAPFFREIVGLNSDGRDVPGCARCFPRERVLDFAAGLDVLVMLLPATAATRNLVDARVLGRLARGALLINAGRAHSLQLADTLQALESRQLSSVVLDVLHREPLPEADPLWAVPGLYITSHTAAPTDTSMVVELFVDNLDRFRRGATLRGIVDFERGY